MLALFAKIIYLYLWLVFRGVKMKKSGMRYVSRRNQKPSHKTNLACNELSLYIHVRMVGGCAAEHYYWKGCSLITPQFRPEAPKGPLRPGARGYLEANPDKETRVTTREHIFSSLQVPHPDSLLPLVLNRLT